MRNITNKEKYLHHLHDTIILLGGKGEISEKIIHLEEVTERDIDNLCQYNIDLIDSVKFKLDKIHTIKVNVKS